LAEVLQRNILKLKDTLKYCKTMDLIFSFHALQQMFKRNISVEQVKYAILNGEEIRSYPDDKPYPSKLLLAMKMNYLCIL